MNNDRTDLLKKKIFKSRHRCVEVVKNDPVVLGHCTTTTQFSGGVLWSISDQIMHVTTFMYSAYSLSLFSSCLFWEY